MAIDVIWICQSCRRGDDLFLNEGTPRLSPSDTETPYPCRRCGVRRAVQRVKILVKRKIEPKDIVSAGPDDVLVAGTWIIDQALIPKDKPVPVPAPVHVNAEPVPVTPSNPPPPAGYDKVHDTTAAPVNLPPPPPQLPRPPSKSMPAPIRQRKTRRGNV